MKPFHVVRGFWLGIPKDFSTAFMSEKKISMTLLDQEGKNYEVTYIAARTGLSGGWKGFAENHNLKGRWSDAGKNLKPEEKPAAKCRRRAPSSVIRDENGSQQQPDDNGDVVDSAVGDFYSFKKIVNDLVGDSEIPITQSFIQIFVLAKILI
ncbi:hypothetical protein MKX03_028373 [Papaver bracteatum]|nr:hypothetical protein MKX03_028373 [Papaver bracteatum]